jgi:hypothetical protein
MVKAAAGIDVNTTTKTERKADFCPPSFFEFIVETGPYYDMNGI